MKEFDFSFSLLLKQIIKKHSTENRNKRTITNKKKCGINMEGFYFLQFAFKTYARHSTENGNKMPEVTTKGT